MRQWRAVPANAKKHRESSRRWYANNTERAKAAAKRYYGPRSALFVARSAASRAADPVRARRWNYFGAIARKYRISRAAFDEMMLAQAGRCAICSEPLADPRVDHDHACCPGGRSCGSCVRGLLCDPCNRGLADFKDSPLILGAAIDYLRR